MKKVKKQMLNVVLFTLLFVIIACVTIGTYAWFTDQKSFSTNELKFGTITLNVTGDSISGENLNVVVTRSEQVVETIKLMPGDTVSLKFNVTLNTGCEPAYYLVSLTGAENLFDESCFYYDSTTKTVVSPTTESPTVGSLTAGTTHTFNLTKQISTDYETQGESVSITLEVYAIQQANLTVTEAYEKLSGTTIPVYTRVTENGKDYIYFGSYPQTVKADSVTVGTTTDENGYYTGSDGGKYFRIEGNPYDSSYTYSDGTTMTATATYFKVEPIKWEILEESDGTAFLWSTSVLSGINWGKYVDLDENYFGELCGELYDYNLTGEERSLMVSVTEMGLQKSENDYVSCLYKDDLNNATWGFATTDDADEARIRKISDYALACGAPMSIETRNGHYETCEITGSNGGFRTGDLYLIDNTGAMTNKGFTRESWTAILGFVPCIKISL